jgi:hypothetical protein
MERRNLPVLPVANNDPDLVKEPERQFGGPQSGLPPPYIVGQELAPYLIVGIDFGTIDCRVATFVKNEPRSILLPVIESRIHFPNYAVDPSEPCATTLYVKEYLGKSFVCKVGDAVYSPADLAVPVLQRVKRDTENSSERLLAKAVITTPACATHTFRQDLLEAAAQADINTIGLLNETTAIGLYWSYINSGQQGTFIALSLGETYWEAALMVRYEKLLEVRAHASRPAPKEKPEWHTTVPTLISELILQSHTDNTEVRTVLIGGRSGPGANEIPRRLDRIVPNAHVPDRLIPDAAACGAAIFAALIVRQAKDLAIWDCVATATMVGEEFSIKPLIAEQSPVPISGHFNFKATADKAQFQVMQRASSEIGTRSVCSVIVQDIPATTDDPRNIDIEVHATADGTLSFNARDIQLDSNLRITVEPAISEIEVLELVPMKGTEKQDEEGNAEEKLEADGITILPDDLYSFANEYGFEVKRGSVLWNLQEQISKAFLLKDQVRLVRASILYGECICLSAEDISLAEYAFDQAVWLSRSELGTTSPLHLQALTKQCWFNLHRHDLLTVEGKPLEAEKYAQAIRQGLTTIASLETTDATNAHALHCYELLRAFADRGMTKAFRDELLLLMKKAVAFAEAANTPRMIIETLEKMAVENLEVASEEARAGSIKTEPEAPPTVDDPHTSFAAAMEEFEKAHLALHPKFKEAIGATEKLLQSAARVELNATTHEYVKRLILQAKKIASASYANPELIARYKRMLELLDKKSSD